MLIAMILHVSRRGAEARRGEVRRDALVRGAGGAAHQQTTLSGPASANNQCTVANQPDNETRER